MPSSTTAAITASTRVGRAGWFQATPCSSVPMATAARATTGRSVNPPRASAPSAVTSAVRLKVGSSGRPTMAAFRKTLRKDSTPATTQVTVCSRLTGMPSMAARSRRSPVARVAMPRSVSRNHRATPASATSDTITPPGRRP